MTNSANASTASTIAALVLLAGCLGCSALPSFQLDDRLPELEVVAAEPESSSTVSLTLRFRLHNPHEVSINFCRTGYRSITIGWLERTTTLDHIGCVKAETFELAPGHTLEWEVDVQLDACPSSDHEFIEQRFPCTGEFEVSAELGLIVGTRCSSRQPCSPVIVMSQPSFVKLALEQQLR